MRWNKYPEEKPKDPFAWCLVWFSAGMWGEAFWDENMGWTTMYDGAPLVKAGARITHWAEVEPPEEVK